MSIELQNMVQVLQAKINSLEADKKKLREWILAGRECGANRDGTPKAWYIVINSEELRALLNEDVKSE